MRLAADDTQVTGELSEQLRRERLLDMEARISPYRRRAFIVLAVALLAAGPWQGWWWLIPLGLAAVAFTFVDRALPGSANPGRWMAGGWAVSPLMIAISVALTGAADSPAIAWFALPAITLATRFERRGVEIGTAYIAILLLGSTVLLEPARVIDDPSTVLFAAALLIGTLMFSGAVIDSDREHRHSSVIDPLTGLLNRTALAQRVSERQLRPAGERRESLGLLIADLDHFKRINDVHGHGTGDAILRDVAYAIRGTLRSFDLAYRIGGEEFLVLLPGVDEQGMRIVAERLRRAAASCSRANLAVTLSVGGALGGGEAEFDQLSAAADGALYQAKAEGRDRFCLADDLPDARADAERGNGGIGETALATS